MVVVAGGTVVDVAAAAVDEVGGTVVAVVDGAEGQVTVGSVAVDASSEQLAAMSAATRAMSRRYLTKEAYRHDVRRTLRLDPGQPALESPRKTPHRGCKQSGRPCVIRT